MFIFIICTAKVYIANNSCYSNIYYITDVIEIYSPIILQQQQKHNYCRFNSLHPTIINDAQQTRLSFLEFINSLLYIARTVAMTKK